MEQENQTNIEKEEKENKYSFNHIKNQLFPLLQVGLKKLLQQLNKNEAVPKYQGDLIQKKIYDRCQKKQLAQQYQSSDSEAEGDYEPNDDISKYSMYKIIRKNLIAKGFDPQMLQQVVDDQKSQKEVDIDHQLSEINEDQQQQVTEQKFNPVLFLAKQMQKAYKIRKSTIK